MPRASRRPHRTLCNRFVRWSRLGVLARASRDLAKPGADGDALMVVQHARHGGEPRGKGGSAARDRPNEGRAELQAARGQQRPRPSSHQVR